MGEREDSIVSADFAFLTLMTRLGCVRGSACLGYSWECVGMRRVTIPILPLKGGRSNCIDTGHRHTEREKANGVPCQQLLNVGDGNQAAAVLFL